MARLDFHALGHGALDFSPLGLVGAEAPSGPPVLPASKIWLDAEDLSALAEDARIGTTNAWVDQNGNYVFANAGAGDDGTLKLTGGPAGGPCVEFIASEYLWGDAVAAEIDRSTGLTLLLVMKRPAVSAAVAILADTTSSSRKDGVLSTTGAWTWLTGQFNTHTAGGPTTTWQVVVHRLTESGGVLTFSGWFNGALVHDEIATSQATGLYNRVVVSDDDNVGTGVGESAFAEIHGWDVALSDIDIASLLTYMQTKYGLW